MTESVHQIIREAWYAHQRHRPYKQDTEILGAITPPGGEWTCLVISGNVARSVMWNHVEVALVNPQDHLTAPIEGEIAMGLRATPVLDTALRVIAVLALDPVNSPLIAKIAETAIGYVEMAAPELERASDDDPGEDEYEE